MPDAVDKLKTKRTLEHNGVRYAYFSLPEAARHIGDVSHLPFSHEMVLENLLRYEDGFTVAPSAHAMVRGLRKIPADQM